MILKKNLFLTLLLLLALITCQSLLAQNQPSPDEFFQQARNAAFEKRDYQLATFLSKKGLDMDPEYADIRIFLGRVYTWSDKIDSARDCFKKVLSEHPENEDASSAYADLEYWNKDPAKSLLICEEGLVFHAESKDLLQKKAKNLIDLKRYWEANDVLAKLLKLDIRNADARSLFEKVQDLNAKNKLGIRYDYTYFDKQFDNPWHLLSLDYSRSIEKSTVTSRLNYANRFNTSAVQFEAEAYPHLSKTFYSYINAGISNKNGVFPQYRAGVSMYANLPNSFEAEAGFRYLYFSSATWIYTASLGKYFKNYWFNFKTYITPETQSISNSYSLATRYYFRGTDYFGLGLSTGISPDERANNIQLADINKLKSYCFSADYRKTFKTFNSFLLGFSFLQQEYLPKITGNQYVFTFGYQRRF